jgi:arsenite methyltransferase
VSTQDIREVVKEKYAQEAVRVTSGGGSCCGGSPSGLQCVDPITGNLYDTAQVEQLPTSAVSASLG